MKRALFAALMAAAIVSGAAAQPSPPAAPQPPAATTVSGVLAFVDDRPAIKTDGATVLLQMPRFFEFAYFKGYKAGTAIRATGLLVPSPDKSTPATILAEEVAIGQDTYIVVQAGPDGQGHGRGDQGPGPRQPPCAPDSGPASGPADGR